MVRIDNRGFSLVELVVVMGIFIGVMIMISSSFERILGLAGHQVKAVETNTEGIIGLEMLRRDIEHAGFGLPWTIPNPPSGGFPFLETSAGLNYPVTGITASSFNTETAGAPCAIKTAVAGQTGKKIIDGSGTTNPGTAYLVIKSTNVALNETAKKWSSVTYQDTAGANTSFIKPWGTAADDFVAGDRVITISSTFSTTGAPDKRLVMDGAAFSYPITGAAPEQPPPGYQPGDGTQQYLVYGIDSGISLTMPYNRADYYIKKPNAMNAMPTHCNPGTGVLYKGVVPQGSTTTFMEYPLLNCVGDMQVEFVLDHLNDGNFDYPLKLTDTDGVTPLIASQIRDQLKNVRVYILAHEGKKDRNYTYPNSTIQVGDPARSSSSGKTWDGSDSCTGDSCMKAVFGTDWKNYRWKVYTIVVHPKNLD